MGARLVLAGDQVVQYQGHGQGVFVGRARGAVLHFGAEQGLKAHAQAFGFFSRHANRPLFAIVA